MLSQAQCLGQGCDCLTCFLRLRSTIADSMARAFTSAVMPAQPARAPEKQAARGKVLV